MPLYVRYGNEPEAFTRTLARIVEGWDRLGSPFACLDITVHAHVFGRPYGAIALLDSTGAGAATRPLLADRSCAAGGAVCVRLSRDETATTGDPSWQGS